VDWTFDTDHVVLDRLREICLALPETSERLSHGSPTYFIRAKKTPGPERPVGDEGADKSGQTRLGSSEPPGEDSVPTTFTGGKSFLMYLDDHHGDGILGIWCAAPDGVQASLVEAEPERFFRPPYVGHRGWLGVRLDHDVDWDEVAGIVEDAYCTVAPKVLVRQVRPEDSA
jgi:hypothetical protein